MGENNHERLSRYLDDDLAEDERVSIEGLLAGDPDQRRELAAMRQLRDTVSELADRMEPPEELDALVEPFRRGETNAGRRSMRVGRWAAAAAALLVAVLVIEVVRQDTEPPATEVAARRQSPRQNDRDRGVFQLQPLPTSARPEGEPPLGATDRLLTTPLPQPMIDDPTPLEIVGPLSAPPSDTQPSARAAILSLIEPTGSVPIPLTLHLPLPVGRYSLVVEVNDGVISEVAVSGRRAASEPVTEALHQVSLANVADGRYPADLTVGLRPQDPQ
jgi:hypothetical protein